MTEHHPGDGPLPDPNATGAPDPVPGEPGDSGRETHERQAAFLRSRSTQAPEADPPGSSRERTRQRAQDLFALLGENARDYAIFWLDVNGIIQSWDEGARLMKWWTKPQAIGAHLRLLYEDGGAEDGTAESHLRSAAETGEYVGEGRRMRSDGSSFWAGTALTALRDDDGSLIGFAKVTRDLTAQHAADAAALRSAAAVAEGQRVREEASRLRDVFVGNVSHEIRTPLNALMGYLVLLERGGDDREKQDRYIARIRSSATHLLEVVNDLLDMSRLEAGQFPVTLAVAATGTAITAALSDIEPQAESKGVELVNSVSSHGAELAYWGDESRVRQILANLLSNAVKFTPTGGRIIVSAGSAETASPDSVLGASGPWVYIRVEDTGEGIPSDRLQAIFEPFTQASTSDAGRGTGLGLSISRRLARLMGGDLSVTSDVGAGSTFVAWLPVAVGSPAPGSDKG